jgi:dipeptidyl aminopeptidase/acylaminoacyl peptidase
MLSGSVEATAGRLMTPEDVVGFGTVEEIRIAPDGRSAIVAFDSARLAENRFETDLYLLPLDPAGASRRLTSSHGGAGSPRWSPDGRWIGFLSDRGGGVQVWRLPADGGEARPVTAHPQPVAGFDWAPDGRQVLFVATAPPGEEETHRRAAGDDAYVLGRQWRNRRLWIAAVTAGAPVVARALTDGTVDVRADAAWSPDGRRIAWVAAPTPESDAAEDSRLQILDLTTGAARDIPGSNRPISFGWSPGGRSLAIVRPFDGREISRADLHLWSPDQPDAPPRDVTAAIDRDVEGFWFQKDGRTIDVLVSRGVVNEVVRVELRAGADAVPRSVWAPGHPVGGPVPLDDGWLYVRRDRPEEIWLARGKAAPRALTELNAPLAAALDLPRIETVRWQSDGLEIEGVVSAPRGAEPGAGARGLLVRPHGGPRWQSYASFDPVNAWFASQGYIVLQPNFRGSTGYGDRFTRGNVGDWGAGPVRDVMAGVDQLIRGGRADGKRLFLYGWSYGGIMANWMATHEDRFRAIISGAGVADLRMQYVISEARRWRFDYFGGSPFLGHEPLYEENSPVTYVRRATTGKEGAPDGAAGVPVLFLEGEEDTICPMPQSLMMHRALLDAGVETELVVYPREGHGFAEPIHIIDRARRVAEWIRRHDSPPTR